MNFYVNNISFRTAYTHNTVRSAVRFYHAGRMILQKEIPEENRLIRFYCDTIIRRCSLGTAFFFALNLFRGGRSQDIHQ